MRPDARFETKHGPADFAPGDRVQFTDTLKPARIYNGNVGTITGIDAETGMIRARLDAAAGQPGRDVAWIQSYLPIALMKNGPDWKAA